MATAYKTEIDLLLKDQVSPGLKTIIKEIERANALVKDLNKAFAGLHFGKGALTGIAQVKKEIEGLKGVTSGVAKAMGTEMKGAFAGVGTEIAGIERKVTSLGDRLKRALSGGGRSIRHSGGGLADAIAFGPMNSGWLAGQRIEEAGGGILAARAELDRQRGLYLKAGASPANVNAGVSAAYGAAALVPDVNVGEQMRLLRELAQVTGDDAGARAALPGIAKVKSDVGWSTHGGGDEGLMDLYKAVELTGVAIDHLTHKIDVSKFNSEIEAGARAISASGGQVKTNDLLQFVKQAGPMVKGVSLNQIAQDYLAVMEDLGGSRAGTGLTAIGRQFIGGIATGKVVGRMQGLGLVGSEGVENTKEGLKITDPSKAIVGYDTLIKEGLHAYMDKYYRPNLAAHGITKREDQNAEMYRSISTETARRTVGLFLSNEDQMKIVAGRYQATKGAGDTYDNLRDKGADLSTAINQLAGSFETLKSSLGESSVVGPALSSFAHGIAEVANVIRANPAIGTGATMGVVGAGAALAAGGALSAATGFGLPAAAAELTAAAKMLQAAAGSQGVPGAGKGAGLMGKVAGALGIGALAGVAQENGILKGPSFGGGVMRGIVKFLDPGLESMIYGQAKEAGQKAGKATTEGFGAAGFNAAGAAAGAAVVDGLRGALGRLSGALSVPGIQSTALHRGTSVPAPPSSRSERPIVVQSVLDGRVIAENTTRHQAQAINVPRRGSDMADMSYLYPAV